MVVGNRADYGRLRPVLLALRAHKKIEPQIILASPALFSHFWWNLKHSEPVSFVKSMPWYVRARLRKMFAGGTDIPVDEMGKMLERDGFKVNEKIDISYKDDTGQAMAYSIGQGVCAFSKSFQKVP